MEKRVSFKMDKKIITLFLTGFVIVFSPIKVQFQKSVSKMNLLSQTVMKSCFTNEKIESITGKKRSAISPKVVKAWKLGSLDFMYSKSCGLVLDHKTLILENLLFTWVSDKKKLEERIVSVIPTIKIAPVLAQRRVSSVANKNKKEIKKTNFRGRIKEKPEDQIAREFLDISERMNFASRCEKKFMGLQGFGPLGKAVKETLSRGSTGSILKHNTSFGGACPGYRSMNLEQRKNLWVFIMMSMSHYESSCRESVTNQGPYGIATGLLQLHGGKEDIYAKWDPDFHCDKGISKNGRRSIQCALTMIGEQIYRGVPLFNENSHWQVLRKVDKPGSQAHQIRYAISQISDCKANPLYFDFDFKVEVKKKIEVHNTRQGPGYEIAKLE